MRRLPKPLSLVLPAIVISAVFVSAATTQRGQSPASEPHPETVTPQSYSAEEVETGAGRFTARCGFCHGRDAGGGEGGPDLTRSLVVAQDAYGDRIAASLSAGGAPDAEHVFDLEPAELRAIAAYIHDRKTQAESLLGGRRFVDTADLQTGDAGAGETYFNGEGGCTACHSARGDLAGVATRFEGLALLRRMLYPTFGRPAPPPPTARITLETGQTLSGPVTYEDEFRIEVTDADGNARGFQKSAVEVTVEDPVQAHFEQLGRYSDREMHDVYAYLETLR